MRMIDADALCDAMYHEAFENDVSYDERNPMARWDSGLWIRYKMFENAIDNAPTIEPKRGEWQNYKDEHYCTNCGEVVIGDWYDEYDWYTYCPNCGAEMRKGADDE